MTSAEAISRPSSPYSRRLSAIGFLLVGLVAVVASLVAWDRRDAVYSSYRRELHNLGIALAEQTERSVQAVNLVLQETQTEVLSGGIATPEQFRQAAASERIKAFLARHSDNLPQAKMIALVASDGTLLNDSHNAPPPVLNLSRCDWYRYLSEHDDPNVFVSQPARDPVSGGWVFLLARRIDGPHHEFIGAAVAGIEAAYLEGFYRAITLNEEGSIALLRRDGTMLARYPHVESAMGKRLPPTSAWHTQVQKGGGSFRSSGFVDGTPRLNSVHPLRDYPLAVTVTIGEAAIAAEWYRQSAFIAGGAFCMAVSFLVVFAALASSARRLEEHTAELSDVAGALRDSEARFRDFATTSSDWFWETDANHRFVYVSDGVCASGLDPRRYIGRSRIEVAAPSDSDRMKWDEHLGVLHRHEPFRNYVYTTKPAEEAERIVCVSGRAFFADDGRFLGYRGTGRDITEESLDERRLYEAKAAAEAANYAKTQFLANVSHELRTPLNAILGFSEMLELGIVGILQAKQHEYVTLIRQSGNHLHEVINDILDFAKVDAGKLDLHDEENVDPRRVFEACFALVKERAKLGSLKLSGNFAEPLPLLIADETRLKQILLNLLSNAVKFTEPGGSVVTTVSRTRDGGVAFAVRDTGTGMTPDELKIAMEPFGQVDGGLSRRHEGTGLGLPLAARLAELHDGSLLVESTKGLGTVVTLFLPPSRVMDQGYDEDFGAAAA